MNSQLKRYIGQDLGESQAQELPFRWSWCLSFSWYVDVITHLEALQTHYWIFMEASSCRHDQSLTPFPAPLLSLENASNHGLVFLLTSLILEPFRAQTDMLLWSYHLEIYKGFKTEPCIRNWGQRPIYTYYYLTTFFSSIFPWNWQKKWYLSQRKKESVSKRELNLAKLCTCWKETVYESKMRGKKEVVPERDIFGCRE